MRTVQSQRQAVQRVDVFPRVIIVEAAAAAHGLAGSGKGAGWAKGPEEIQRGKGGDCAARGYGGGLGILMLDWRGSG